MIASMARPFDDDSGVPSAPEVQPPFQDDPAARAQRTRAYWASQQGNPTPPPITGVWSYGITPTLTGQGLGNKTRAGLGFRGRSRWGFVVAGALLAAGALAALTFLPKVPAPLQPVHDALASLIRGTPPPPAVPALVETEAARGPRIVQLPSDVPAPAPAPVMAGRLPHRPGSLVRENGRLARSRLPSLRARAEAESWPEAEPPPAVAVPIRPAPVAPIPAAPVARAAAPATASPFPEADDPRAAPAPRPVEARPAPGSLDELMNGTVKELPPRGKSEIDQRLATIDEKHEAAPRARAAPEEAAHNLTPGEIQTAMKPIQRKVTDCGRQFQASGAADMKVTVAADGSVSNVAVGGVFAGTPTAGCIERAVKTAVFPASRGLRFDYPLALR
jgi:hypothetical protein